MKQGTRGRGLFEKSRWMVSHVVVKIILGDFPLCNVLILTSVDGETNFSRCCLLMPIRQYHTCLPFSKSQMDWVWCFFFSDFLWGVVEWFNLGRCKPNASRHWLRLVEPLQSQQYFLQVFKSPRPTDRPKASVDSGRLFLRGNASRSDAEK